MLSLLLTLATAHGWDAIGATWAPDAFPIPYRIASELDDDLDDAAAVAAIQEAFATWEAVDCAELSFEYLGRSDQSTWAQSDGENTVFLFGTGWSEDSELASTPNLITASQRIVEADLALNGQHYAWSVDAADGVAVLDVQAGMTHEIGHLLGLWHSQVQGATLNPSMLGHPDARTLEADDLDGICSLYGEGAAEHGLGSACEQTIDCDPDLVCLVDGSRRYCTLECDDTCPEGYECIDAGDTHTVCAKDLTRGCGCHSVPPLSRTLLGPWLLALSALTRRRR